MEKNKEILHDIESAVFVLSMSDEVPKVGHISWASNVRYTLEPQ